MNLTQWVKRQGFLPEWLVGKSVRVVKWHPIVEHGFHTLIDGLVVKELSDNQIEFDNGDILQLPEDSGLILDYKIQVYRGSYVNGENDLCARMLGDKVIIELPLSILEQSQRLRDDVCYDILNKEDMGEYFANNIIWHSRDMGDQEIGASVLTHLIDDVFDHAYECGETWLENKNEEEY